MEILFFILPGFIFWWFLKRGEESSGVLKISQWYFVLPFATFGIIFFLFYAFLITFVLFFSGFGHFFELFEDFISLRQKAVYPFIFSCLTGILLGISHKKIKPFQKFFKLFVPEDRDNFDWIRKRLEDFGTI